MPPCAFKPQRVEAPNTVRDRLVFIDGPVDPRRPALKFNTIIQSSGNNTGIEVPAEVVEALGQGKKPPVRVTLGGHTYRSTVASRGGRFLVSLSAENRAAAGVEGGDRVDVEIELDTEPREVPVPSDLAERLAAEPEAAKFFESLSYSQKQWYVLPIEQAKQPETRERRLEKAMGMLREGRKR